ncbi:MAG: DUF5329 family protein [Deltaproteobacteria bacterium]|nr:DUF5329 family protein [Deltaproteobacteria bacterium]
MKAPRIRLLFTVLILLLVHGLAFALDAAEEQKINALIQIVRSLREEKFIRNGQAYDTDKAVRLISYKYNKEKPSLTTAIEFIEKCAAKSNTTGMPYQIKFPDGKVQNSEDFLKAKLGELERNGTHP